ncbi:hypothetical protein C8J57DRAFT_1659789 [Mycena rebaudengoi]|nr:hypothetical protein C8J57DRAFT_1659789 [Mycena rebaudengoi]
MSEALACDIVKQDCATLYPSISLNYTSHSCVRDLRYDWGGTVGRCGWPGAECSVLTTASESNCGRMNIGAQLDTAYGKLCVDGICRGAPGDICESPETCNFGVSCNVSSSDPPGSKGICGGTGAEVTVYGRTIGSPGSGIINELAVQGQISCLSGKLESTAGFSSKCAAGNPVAEPPLSDATVILSRTSAGSSSPTGGSGNPPGKPGWGSQTRASWSGIVLICTVLLSSLTF